MYSAYKLNKQGDNIQPWHTPFLIWNQSVVACPILMFCINISLSSVQSLSRVRLFVTPWIAARQASLSITNSQSSLKPRPSSQWCHPAISSSVVPFSFCPQSLPASESFPMSQLFAWGGQSPRVSALASVLPMNIQDWFPLGLIGFISLQSNVLSTVFSNTTVQKYQFFGSAFFVV